MTMLPLLGFTTSENHLLYKSYELHTSILRLEIKADSLEMVQSVSFGVIDKV
jgi:hypothetical protein